MSDNFHAEMLLKHLGKKERGAGTTAAGASSSATDAQRARGVPLAGRPIADGSGSPLLRRADRAGVGALLIRPGATPGQVSASSPRWRSPAWTGRSRTAWRRGPARGRVRAKTGTTMHGLGPLGLRRDALRLRRPPERRSRFPGFTPGARRTASRRSSPARPLAHEQLLERGLVEDLDAGLARLLELRPGALPDDDAGRLLRDRVGDLRALGLERGAAPPRATSARASP